jgi:hypothetical protein
MLKKNYKIIKNSPKPIDWETYSNQALINYQKLLNDTNSTEDTFQKFFEQNPSFIPGAFSLNGESGHSPYPFGVISQPNIKGICNRIPDFVWLSNDSCNFNPIFVEIETPKKNLFNKDGTPTSTFTQALNQFSEWKALLCKPENILSFYNQFDIPKWLRELKFQPQFALIYGRREEYINNEWYKQKRSELMRNHEYLFSYDRLLPNPKSDELFCLTVSEGRYYAKHITPNFRFGPSTSDYLCIIKGITDAIIRNNQINEKRKKFLLKRINYWIEYASMGKKGLYNPSDTE